MKRVPVRDDPRLLEAPPFWPSTVAEVDAFFATCRKAEVRQIGASAGGRPLLAVTYGPKERRQRRMPFHVAVTHDDILDIGLIMLEEVMALGLYEGFLPQGWKW